MHQNREVAAEDMFEENYSEFWEEGSNDDFDDFEDELEFESFPPELLARSMSDALERLKDFDPFAV